jgi:hypothetical protein
MPIIPEIIRQIVLILILIIGSFTPREAKAPAASVIRPDPSPSTKVTKHKSRLVAAGAATYYRWLPGQAAAGPALRRALGKDWRGSRVLVCRATRCVSVVLSDWCACGARHGVPTVIDLDVRVFARLAPKSLGVIPVTVRLP